MPERSAGSSACGPAFPDAGRVCAGARGEQWFGPPVRRREHDGEVGRRVMRKHLEQVGERVAEAVDCVDAEAAAPATLHDRRHIGPDGAGAPGPGGEAHDAFGLGRRPQGLARRRLDRYVPPPLQPGELESARARPLRHETHRRPSVVDVPQDVGVHGERREPRSPPAFTVVGTVTGGRMRQAQFRLVVHLDRQGDQRLREQHGERALARWRGHASHVGCEVGAPQARCPGPTRSVLRRCPQWRALRATTARSCPPTIRGLPTPGSRSGSAGRGVRSSWCEARRRGRWRRGRGRGRAPSGSTS